MPTMTRTRLAAAALCGVLTFGMASPAVAQDTEPADTGTESQEHSLPALKARCQEAIDVRLDALAAAQVRVQGIDALTDAHEQRIDDIIDRSQAGLTALSNQIEDAVGLEETLRLCARVAPDFRVFLVVLPQIHLTVAADRSEVAVTIGDEVIVKLDEAIERAADAGADVTEAQALRDAAEAHLRAADAANDGVAASALSVTPADWNDGNGAQVLATARSHMRVTHDELKGAREDGLAAGQALRDALEAIV